MVSHKYDESPDYTDSPERMFEQGMSSIKAGRIYSEAMKMDKSKFENMVTTRDMAAIELSNQCADR
jgi:hypothetical protein